MPATIRRRTALRPQAHATDDTPARKSTNLTLATGLVAEARELGVNLSQAAEAGIAAAVAHRRRERWLAENRDALDSSNAFVEEHGLPLARYRNF
ncbi:MAG: type II toxin-antitoxin system CcdA family antitoxin [Burkholderiaceae bacterium]|jgi:antitoxin CcdA|nr:type II toxin-antitoxin system CcdA family antitoxin [Burkholderiaceae bacterium]MEB2317187.1 type II toxin-antitoxin system CcdA family antitoxin [Pseudomonadota bacterium]